MANVFDSVAYWNARRAGKRPVRPEQHVMDAVARAIDGLKKRKLLDYGCGLGRWNDFFTSHACDYTGLDSSDVSIAIANDEFEGDFRTPETLTHVRFDIVFTCTVVIHCEDGAAVADELSDLVNKGGRLIMVESVWESAWISAHLAKRPPHMFYRTREEFLDLFSDALWDKSDPTPVDPPLHLWSLTRK